MDYDIMTKDSNERTRARRTRRKASPNWGAKSNKRTQARKKSRARQRNCQKKLAALAE